MDKRKRMLFSRLTKSYGQRTMTMSFYSLRKEDARMRSASTMTSGRPERTNVMGGHVSFRAEGLDPNIDLYLHTPEEINSILKPADEKAFIKSEEELKLDCAKKQKKGSFANSPSLKILLMCSLIVLLSLSRFC